MFGKQKSMWPLSTKFSPLVPATFLCNPFNSAIALTKEFALWSSAFAHFYQLTMSFVVQTRYNQLLHYVMVHIGMILK